MDAIVESGRITGRPTQEEAEEAVRTLILWAGDDPEREGLLETRRTRVARSYNEFYAGYDQDPEQVSDENLRGNRRIRRDGPDQGYRNGLPL